MICYRDRRFCTQTTCQKFGDAEDDCPRSLTDKVRADAKKWWRSDDPPIDQANYTKCFKPITKP